MSYCYFMALISGDEWLMEAQVDLATNLVHQAIYGYLNNVLPFPADSDSNSGRAAWNPSCPTDRWTGLMAQWQADAIRAMGWTQLIQGHAIALVPVDHVAHDYLQAAMVHQGDFIQTNLDYLPADFTAAAFYSPNSQLGPQCLFSPWMIAFVAVGAYAHYLANEDSRWKRLGDFAAAWSIKQAALGRWYAFDIYRTSHRKRNDNWNASTNPETPIEQQGVLELYADLDASTGVFTCNYPTVWSTGLNPPPLTNGDRLTFSAQQDGAANGVIPAGATDGQVCYVVNLVQGVLTGTYNPTNPVKFQSHGRRTPATCA